jgi:hypothetical protein
MIRRCVAVAVLACLAPGCFGSVGPSSSRSRTPTRTDAVASPIGPALHAERRSYTGRIKGGIGSYAAQTTVTDTQRSLQIGQRGRLMTIRGIGSVAVACLPHPTASFNLTSWAQGEGPPRVAETSARTRGLISLAGLAGTYTVPKGETTDQVVYQWEISEGDAGRHPSATNRINAPELAAEPGRWHSFREAAGGWSGCWRFPPLWPLGY